ncbi:MAG: four helix bundle protein [Candidatus Muiribacteriota bacterium]
MGHKNLRVYQNSLNLVEKIYKITGKFPDEEKFGLISQMRRAAVSIPSNIAEGAAKTGNKEFKRFIDISLGSLMELGTQIEICCRLEYITDRDNIDPLFNKVKAELIGLRRKA